MSNLRAAQCSNFKQERTLAAIDLANSIKRKNVYSVLNIGCGTGNSTAVLARKFPCAKVTGADNSMICLQLQKKSRTLTNNR